jgi:hypothetical protein
VPLAHDRMRMIVLQALWKYRVNNSVILVNRMVGVKIEIGIG